MTATPEPTLVEMQVPAEQVRVGDHLCDPEGVVERVMPDVHSDYVYAFTPDQVPMRRDSLVRVRRRPATVEPAPVDADPVTVLREQLAEVRDLALTIADGTSTAAQRAKVTAAADKVRARGKA